MNWQIDFSSNANKFLEKNKLQENAVLQEIVLAIKKIQGEDVNVDLKKLKGEWKGFYRIRSGKLRIIVDFHFERHRVFVEGIEWRGNIYK